MSSWSSYCAIKVQQDEHTVMIVTLNYPSYDNYMTAQYIYGYMRYSLLHATTPCVVHTTSLQMITLASSSVSLPSEIVHSRILAQNHNSHNISLYLIKLYCYIYFIQSQD